jgi:kynureninase
MGHERPFDFSPDYAPAGGAARFAAGTPQILSLVALDAALDLFDGLDMSAVESKARALGDLFMSRAVTLGLETISPLPGAPRGGQASFSHPKGYEIMQALIHRGVIGDFRPPDVMRFGFSPLILSFAEVARAADMLAQILASGEWRDPRFAARKKVT